MIVGGHEGLAALLQAMKVLVQFERGSLEFVSETYLTRYIYPSLEALEDAICLIMDVVETTDEMTDFLFALEPEMFDDVDGFIKEFEKVKRNKEVADA